MATQNTPVRRVEGGGDLVPGGASIEALSNVPRDLALIKMDNDSMIAMAAARPRDYGEIIKDIKSQLQNFKSFAVNARYAKPVGKMDKCPACGAETRYRDNCPRCNAKVPQKYATGLSIRAAEALACAYKYNRIDSESVDETEDKTRLTVSFVDYQTGRVVRDSTLVSKTYKTRAGDTKRYDDDRFYGVVLKAKKAVMIRDNIMKMVPPGMRSELEVCVEEQLAGFLDENTVKAIVANFSQKGVSPEMLEVHFGKRLSNFNKEDRALLASIWTSLQDGETSVEDIFGGGGDSPSATGEAVKDLPEKLAAARKAGGVEPQTKTPAAKPSKQAPQGKAAPVTPKVPPPPPPVEDVTQEIQEPEPQGEPQDSGKPNPLAPDPTVQLPVETPYEPAGEPEPETGPEHHDEPGDAAGDDSASPDGLFGGLLDAQPEAEPEEDMEKELRAECYKQLRATINKIMHKGNAKGSKVVSQVLGANGLLPKALAETGTRNIAGPDQYSLDAMNALAQKLEEILAWVDEQK